MEIVSLFAEASAAGGRVIRVIYKLLEDDGGYGVLCYIAGSSRQRVLVRGAFRDRGVAEYVLQRIAAGGVMPMQIGDVLADLAC